MAKYRKKPVVVEAEQWLGPESKIEGVREATPEDEKYLANFVVLMARAVDPNHRWYVIDVPPSAYILGDVCYLYPGAWVLTDDKGQKSLCLPGIFEATYERILPDPPYCEPGDD